MTHELDGFPLIYPYRRISAGSIVRRIHSGFDPLRRISGVRVEIGILIDIAVFPWKERLSVVKVNSAVRVGVADALYFEFHVSVLFRPTHRVPIRAVILRKRHGVVRVSARSRIHVRTRVSIPVIRRRTNVTLRSERQAAIRTRGDKASGAVRDALRKRC